MGMTNLDEKSQVRTENYIHALRYKVEEVNRYGYIHFGECSGLKFQQNHSTRN